MITQQELKELLSYNPETGEFTWKVNRSRLAKAGQIAGCDDGTGYRAIHIKGKSWKAHRLVFIWHTGDYPKCIDHINGNKSDNRWENLRPATRGQNNQNQSIRSDNTSGFKGVYYLKKNRKWAAQVTVDGKQKYLGLYQSEYEAGEVARKAREHYHGEYANHG